MHQQLQRKLWRLKQKSNPPITSASIVTRKQHPTPYLNSNRDRKTKSISSSPFNGDSVARSASSREKSDLNHLNKNRPSFGPNNGSPNYIAVPPPSIPFNFLHKENSSGRSETESEPESEKPQSIERQNLFTFVEDGGGYSPRSSVDTDEIQHHSLCSSFKKIFFRASSAVRGAGRSIFSSCRKTQNRDAESIFIRRVREAEEEEKQKESDDFRFLTQEEPSPEEIKSETNTARFQDSRPGSQEQKNPSPIIIDSDSEISSPAHRDSPQKVLPEQSQTSSVRKASLLATASPAPIYITKENAFHSPGPSSPAVEEDRAEGLRATKKLKETTGQRESGGVRISTRNSTTEDNLMVHSSGQKESVQSFSSKSTKMKLIKLRPTPQAEDFADHFSRSGNDNYLVTIEDEDALKSDNAQLKKEMLDQIDEVPCRRTFLKSRKKTDSLLEEVNSLNAAISKKKKVSVSSRATKSRRSSPTEMKPKKRSKRSLRGKEDQTLSVTSHRSGPVTRSMRSTKVVTRNKGYKTPKPFQHPVPEVEEDEEWQP